MFSKNNKKMIIQKEQEKINYYGIKKFNAGTASVLIAAGFAFLGGGSALASNDAPATIANTETVNNNVIANKEEVSTTTPAKANKTNLSAAIARVQEAIANARVTEKTASVIEDSKAELVKAQALEGSEVATQGEVDRETVALSFCILSNTNAFEDSSTVNVSTSDCWMSERDTTCCAFDNNSFAAVIVAVVFSVSFTFTNN